GRSLDRRGSAGALALGAGNQPGGLRLRVVVRGRSSDPAVRDHLRGGSRPSPGHLPRHAGRVVAGCPGGAGRLPRRPERQAWRTHPADTRRRPAHVTASRFVVQLHDATTLHFDLRVQAGTVLRSWAVPKGPSLDPAVRRLAVPVEDHTLEAGEFEGVYPGARRGTGAVMCWGEGPAEIPRGAPGPLSFAAPDTQRGGEHA